MVYLLYSPCLKSFIFWVGGSFASRGQKIASQDRLVKYQFYIYFISKNYPSVYDMFFHLSLEIH